MPTRLQISQNSIAPGDHHIPALQAECLPPEAGDLADRLHQVKTQLESKLEREQHA